MHSVLSTEGLPAYSCMLSRVRPTWIGLLWVLSCSIRPVHACLFTNFVCGVLWRAVLSCRSDNSTANSCSADQDKIVLPLDENERVLGLQMALKCADVGHVTASLPVHIR
jgi:hypothetical protein